ncbi:MAG: hypothetical protein B6240_12915 [Desulfobacteraceae bacterium 4572_87]|nr:MAG: hypothetical protein B6240_12915 [Desulfobacteraceae bacterium 4572_87]
MKARKSPKASCPLKQPYPSCSFLLEPGLAFTGRMLAFCGALSFYISDLFVARDRFVKKKPINRILGLPLYFGGQFLLAFSIGYL